MNTSSPLKGWRRWTRNSTCLLCSDKKIWKMRMNGRKILTMTRLEKTPILRSTWGGDQIAQRNQLRFCPAQVLPTQNLKSPSSFYILLPAKSPATKPQKKQQTLGSESRPHPAKRPWTGPTPEPKHKRTPRAREARRQKLLRKHLSKLSDNSDDSISLSRLGSKCNGRQPEKNVTARGFLDESESYELVDTSKGYRLLDCNGEMLVHMLPKNSISAEDLEHACTAHLDLHRVYRFRLPQPRSQARANRISKPELKARVFRRGNYPARHFGCWTRVCRMNYPIMTREFRGISSSHTIRAQQNTAVRQYFQKMQRITSFISRTFADHYPQLFKRQVLSCPAPGPVSCLSSIYRKKPRMSSPPLC